MSVSTALARVLALIWLGRCKVCLGPTPPKIFFYLSFLSCFLFSCIFFALVTGVHLTLYGTIVQLKCLRPNKSYARHKTPTEAPQGYTSLRGAQRRKSSKITEAQSTDTMSRAHAPYSLKRASMSRKAVVLSKEVCSYKYHRQISVPNEAVTQHLCKPLGVQPLWNQTQTRPLLRLNDILPPHIPSCGRSSRSSFW